MGVDQFCMRALLHDPTLVKHYDIVCIPDGTETVGYHQYRSAFKKLVETFQYHFFVVSIQGISGLVEKKIGRRFIHCPRNQDALSLACAYTSTLVPYFGIVTKWKAFNKLTDMSNLTCMIQFFILRCFVSGLCVSMATYKYRLYRGRHFTY